MSAYAALVSLMHVVEQVLRPNRHFILVKGKQIQTLREKVCSLQKFLEDYSHQINKLKTTDGLESQMANASHAAEDIIESFVLDQILAARSSNKVKSSCLMRFSQDIEKMIEEMDRIEGQVVKVKKEMSSTVVKDRQSIYSSRAAEVTRFVRASGNTTVSTHVLGLENQMVQVKERLSGDYKSKPRIVSIVGTGGIGKTTLARKVYDDSFTLHRFQLRAWVVISQEYVVRDILLVLLYEVANLSEHKTKQESHENIISFTNNMSHKSNEQLGDELYKRLWGRRYLIVMDDMWSTDVWEKVRKYFPKNENGSRIMITTRQSKVAIGLRSDNIYNMAFLNEGESWNLFCAKVGSPLGQLEDLGKKIAKNCKGLPLALVVIGGLLAKSKKTREYWIYVAENLNSIINSEGDEHCLKMLYLSYSDLPVHLKPCILYLATFPEDCEVFASRLIKLWIAEGFLKPKKDKSLEEVAEEYLKELIDRNLIEVCKRGSLGNIKSLMMHDLIRDLCLREAERENFYCITRVYSLDIPPGLERMRRLGILRSPKERNYRPDVLNALRSASVARSLVCKFKWISPWLVPSLKLLWVLDVVDMCSPADIMQLINSRYLSFRADWNSNSGLDSSISFLWNLQTLIVHGYSKIILPSEIWEMTQLRHIKLEEFVLPDPCSQSISSFCILKNLQTLSTVRDFRCTKQVLQRVPNLKKLKISYQNPSSGAEWSHYCLKNLVHLDKLGSLTCKIHSDRKISAENIAFPRSLRKLTLMGCHLPWEDMKIIASLPKIEVLKLERYAFKGQEWNMTEGMEFDKLKFLLIGETDLKYWRTHCESEHFRSLEHLVLHRTKLKEIPLALAECSSLRLIQLKYCADPDIITSAKPILEEQENSGNENLQIQVQTSEGMKLYTSNMASESIK